MRARGWFSILVVSLVLCLGCKKKQPESTEKEPEDPNRCTYSTPDRKCPDGKFCFVSAKDLATKDPAKDKIWGTCVDKKKIGEECQSADDCADPNALCDSDSDEADAKTVCTLD